MAVSDITNPPMDDEPTGTPVSEALGDEKITNPPMDDENDGGPTPGSSIENPPA